MLGNYTSGTPGLEYLYYTCTADGESRKIRVRHVYYGRKADGRFKGLHMREVTWYSYFVLPHISFIISSSKSNWPAV